MAKRLRGGLDRPLNSTLENMRKFMASSTRCDVVLVFILKAHTREMVNAARSFLLCSRCKANNKLQDGRIIPFLVLGF